MALTVRKLMDIINTFAPFDLAENWDNSGLQAGSLNWPVHKIMVSLDVSMAVMDEAAAFGADLVLTHHPLFIGSKKSIDFGQMPGSAIALAAREKINILSIHTNLDKASNGLNDYFAKILGVDCDESLQFASQSDDSQLKQLNDKPSGLGRIGKLMNHPGVSLQNLAVKVKERLGVDHLRIAGDLDLCVDKIALCTGSGGSLIGDFLRSSADVYITGDIKYHEAKLIEEHHKGLIDVGHFASEVIVVDMLIRRLEQVLFPLYDDIKLKGFKKEKDPFKTV